MLGRYLSLSLLCAGVAIAAIPGTAPAIAQTYPAQPIKLMIGFGPGSAADVLARVVCKQMESSLGQPIVIENRPGNSSMIAAEAVMRAPADGYTLFLAGATNAINATLYDKLSFNFLTDVAPIAAIIRFPNVLEVNRSFPAQTVPEFIAPHEAQSGQDQRRFFR